MGPWRICENLGALKDASAQRFALLESIRQFDAKSGAAVDPKSVRERLEPTLTPATYASVRVTHIISDILTIVALVAMELRRRRFREVLHAP